MNTSKTVSPLASILIVVSMIAALLVLMSALREHYLGDLPQTGQHCQKTSVFRESMFSPFVDTFTSTLSAPGACILPSDMFCSDSPERSSGNGAMNAIPSISSILRVLGR